MQFSGSIPALVTPFVDGSFSREALRGLVDWHVEQGSSGLVVCGTTGECPTLSLEEHVVVIAEAVKVARGRIPIIAGAGSNSTQEALFLTRASEQAGADAVLHVTGYYNKPTQKQVVEHFRAIDRITRLPIIVYNIPSRTGQELSRDHRGAGRVRARRGSEGLDRQRGPRHDGAAADQPPVFLSLGR